jgi:SP family sugar:H+ symporter-like MFS transporter
MAASVKSNRWVYFFGALGGLLFGYDTGVISGAILYIKEDFDLSPFLEGAVVAALLLGAMVGAAAAGPLSDRLGRRNLVLSAAVIFTIGALGAALAPGIGALLAARFVLGLAVGSAALVVPLYLSEIAPTEIRGAVASLNQLMIVGGILAAYIVNAALASTEEWRLMVGAAVVPSLILFFGMLAMPESPRFLVRRGDEDEAREVLEDIRDDEATVKEELAEIEDVETEEQEHAGLREVFAPWVRPALIVAVGLAVFQQLIGINTIIYYAPTTLTNVGYSDASAIYANLVIGVLNVIATVVAIRIVDRVGRKPMLLGGLIGMVASLTVLGLSSLLMAEPNSPSDPAALITLACLATFIVSFATTWGPVVWVMLPEVLPLSVRGAAMGFAICLHWFANFVVSQTFPIALDEFGAGAVFLGYAAIGVVAFGFVTKFVTETKGRSLEEIEASLQDATGIGDDRTERFIHDAPTRDSARERATEKT